ncbi:MAG: serine/threonine-protein kinase [Planctomycetota bacterium]
MTDESRIYDLFDRARQVPEPEREAFIDLEADDAHIAEGVRELIKQDADTPEAFLSIDEPASAHDPQASPDETQPERIGPYRVIREIGRGGMGVVYEAAQESPDRHVALKVMSVGLGRPDRAGRFKREVQALGKLQHRGIAHIYDSGSASLGDSERPFYTMELIDGPTLEVYAEQHGLGTRQKLELIARVCDAVQHAHQKGVIHRDLKPANVLVVSDAGSSRDSTNDFHDVGQPKILDFGIARFTDADMQATMQTDTGQIIGTLAYMSPEQLDGRPDDLDTRVDVYALGVMLYTILVGRPPHDIGTVPVPEALRRIKEDEPTRLRTFDISLRGDVETIVEKAMSKDRDRRYVSAAALSEDIRRYLSSEPIAARPPSAAYQLRKFAGRNRALVGGIATTMLVILLGIIGTTIGLVSAVRANRTLEQTNVQLGQANETLEVTNAQLDATNESLVATKSELEQSNADLERIVGFQQRQLETVDVRAVGDQQRDRLLADVAAEDAETLTRLLNDINFADQARLTLDASIFIPTTEAIETEFADSPEIQGRLHSAVGTARRSLGLFEEANTSLQRAVELLDPMTAADPLMALLAKERLAQVRIDQGRFEDAERLYREQLEEIKALYGESDLGVYRCMQGLAVALWRQGKAEEAEAYLTPAIEAYEDITNGADAAFEDLLRMKSTRAAIRHSVGDYETSIRIDFEALDGYRKLYGNEDSRTQEALSNLARTLADVGRYEEAERLAREAMQIGESTFGRSHPDTLSVMSVLAWVLNQTGRYTEEETIRREVLDRRRETLGPSHPRVGGALNNLAACIDSQGRYEEAEALYSETLTMLLESLGPDHLHTLSTMNNLGSINNALGRTEESARYYRDAFVGLRRVVGAEHPNTLVSMSNLAFALLAMGQVEEAEPLLIEAFETARRTFGEEHPRTIKATFNKASFLVETNRTAEAEPLCIDALDRYAQMKGDDHFDTLRAVVLMGRLRMAQDRHEDAEVFFRDAAERRARVLGEDHPDTQNARRLLAAAGDLTKDDLTE